MPSRNNEFRIRDEPLDSFYVNLDQPQIALPGDDEVATGGEIGPLDTEFEYRVIDDEDLLVLMSSRNLIVYMVKP